MSHQLDQSVESNIFTTFVKPLGPVVRQFNCLPRNMSIWYGRLSDLIESSTVGDYRCVYLPYTAVVAGLFAYILCV